MTHAQRNELLSIRDSISELIASDGVAQCGHLSDVHAALEELIDLHDEAPADRIWELEDEISSHEEDLDSLKQEKSELENDFNKLVEYIKHAQQILTEDQYEQLVPLQPDSLELHVYKALGW
jgi:predicted nuclease with TOPRIM domain